MTEEYLERLAELGARERAAMERGDTLDIVIKRLREEGLNTVAANRVVRHIKEISLQAAKQLVAHDSELPKLDLDDLALLASIPHVCKAASWLPFWLEIAIIDRDPHAHLEGVMCDEVKRAVAEEPAWAREIEIVHDEPELLTIRFVRVR